MARTYTQIKELITKKYRSHFSSNKENHSIKITHLDDSNTLLKKVFLQGKCPNIQVEVTPINPAAIAKDSNIIKLNNLDEMAQDNYHLFDGEAVLKNPKGLSFVQVQFIPSIDHYVFPHVLRQMGNQLYFLNKWLNTQQLTDWLVHVYGDWVRKDPEIPRYIDLLKIEDIAKKIITNPIPPIKGKVEWLWNPDYNLTDVEKQQVVNQVNGEVRQQDSLGKLKSAYSKGISKNELIRKSGMSKPTIYKYWDQLKSA